MEESKEAYRSLPSVNAVLALPGIKEAHVPRGALLQAVRDELAEVRREIASLAPSESDPHGHAQLDTLAFRVLERAYALVAPSPMRVVNATGVVLHTNLGRAPLSKPAIDAISEAVCYCDLEYSLSSGDRGSRHAHVSSLLKRVTGAESGIALNNNAAATLLVLAALAASKEVIVSRGELVEIGGSFRIPDIMRQSGARIVEVGTTNRTRLSDYEDAITSETALILKVHTSNYRMVGFTESVEPKELSSLARKHGILLFHDAGSGLMVDLAEFGLSGEPEIPGLVRDGCDLVAFSGDKLLGGPQAGIIVGQKHLVDRIKNHPLARAMRLDKVTLASLSATLRVYAYGFPLSQIPVLRMLTESREQIEQKAMLLASQLRSVLPHGDFSVCETLSYPGGGSYPGVSIRSAAVRVEIPGVSVLSLMQRMRRFSTPIVARAADGVIWLDPRTLQDDDPEVICTFFGSL